MIINDPEKHMSEIMEEGVGLGIRKPEVAPSESVTESGKKTENYLNRIKSGASVLAAEEPEYEGEPNTEGLQICDHCGNPSQYLYSAGARARIYCSDHCRKAESNQA